ncbi:thiolase family protein [Egbenema bharatensis]|uniref:thiolase family protein n=1 Tax=Egbenema bharatensis TaxID=3463334 RepID=UPI003A841F82
MDTGRLPPPTSPLPIPLIIAARRSPIGRAGRSLRSLTAAKLMVPVLQALLIDSGLAAAQVEEVILGNAVGGGGNLARLAALTAGFPVTVPGLTIDRQCGSGLEAISLAARLIQSGAVEAVIAGGVESVSTAPWRVEKPKSLYDLPQFVNRAQFSPDGIGDPDMGIAAENVAQKYDISRDRQDQYALRSHQKAIDSIQSGRFQSEIVPIGLPGASSIDTDECPRSNLTLERLAKLPPAFREGGTVTVGNTCPINDGAAAVLMISDRLFHQLGLTQGLRVVDTASAGVDPNLLGIAPIASTQKLLNRHPELSIDQIDLVEFNEAFAAQVLACLDGLSIPESKVNVGGGAIALGHPYGASGAILVTRLFTELVRRESSARLGLATMGIAGGLGVSLLVEKY